MNKYLKRFLFILGALLYYAGGTIGFGSVLSGMNMASWWFVFAILVVHIIITCPTVIVIILSLFGELDDMFTDEEEIDEELLVHAVINQLEADFGDNDFDSMSDMLETLISDENDSKDVLWQYLSNTAQENLKEGLTIKRWED